MNQKNGNIYKLIIELFKIYKLNTQKNISEVSNLWFTLESLKQDKSIDYSLCYIKIISELLKEQLYFEIINFHTNHLTQISENINDDYMLKYNVILWVCHQELWELDIADWYYNHFLNGINVNKKDITEKLNENKLKFMFLIREIWELWFTYKVNKDEYNRYKKNKNKILRKKEIRNLSEWTKEEEKEFNDKMNTFRKSEEIWWLKKEFNIDFESLYKEFNHDYLKHLPPFVIVITQLWFFITDFNPLQNLTLSPWLINIFIFIIIGVIWIFITLFLFLYLIIPIWIWYLFFIKHIVLKSIFIFFKNKKVQMISLSQQNIIISILVWIWVLLSSIIFKAIINWT